MDEKMHIAPADGVIVFSLREKNPRASFLRARGWDYDGGAADRRRRAGDGTAVTATRVGFVSSIIQRKTDAPMTD